MARIVRGEVIRLKGTDYAAAARMEGLSRMRILWRHLLPNAAGPILVNLIFLVPQAIFTEAFLSFLGVGIAPLAVLCVMLLAVNAVGTALEGAVSKGKNR